MRKIVKRLVRGLGVEVVKVPRGDDRCASLRPTGQVRGRVLLSYILDPFLETAGHTEHSQSWRSWQIAQIFLELGYAVDVIDYKNRSFRPEAPYAFFIDVRFNMQRLAPQLPADCAKIFLVDVAHTLFNSYAEFNRLLGLQQRRGITLKPRRYEEPNLGIEHADCALVIGNGFTLGTFRYAGKPLYPVPNVSTVLYPEPRGKDMARGRKHFLWLGSYGMVHKGLDLVLEAFAGMPDHRLTVCGPIKREPDFEQAFHRELYQTANITTVGWIDVASPEFRQLLNECAGVVYASSSEGQAGSVITAMHGGLIPVISHQCGIDVDDFGVLLPNCQVDGIREAVRQVSGRPVEALEAMAQATWQTARAHYTKERFTEQFRTVVAGLIERSNAGRASSVREGVL